MTKQRADQNQAFPHSGAPDILFLTVGALTAYLYYALKRILHDHNEYHRTDLVLTGLIGFCAFFYLGLLIIAAFTAAESEFIFSAFWIGGLIIFGVMDITLGILLLRDAKQLPDMIRMFATVNVILGICELSVILSFATVLIYPISALILALHFLRKPDLIEIV